MPRRGNPPPAVGDLVTAAGPAVGLGRPRGRRRADRAAHPGGRGGRAGGACGRAAAAVAGRRCGRRGRLRGGPGDDAAPAAGRGRSPAAGPGRGSRRVRLQRPGPATARGTSRRGRWQAGQYRHRDPASGTAGVWAVLAGGWPPRSRPWPCSPPAPPPPAGGCSAAPRRSPRSPPRPWPRAGPTRRPGRWPVTLAGHGGAGGWLPAWPGWPATGSGHAGAPAGEPGAAACHPAPPVTGSSSSSASDHVGTRRRQDGPRHRDANPPAAARDPRRVVAGRTAASSRLRQHRESSRSRKLPCHPPAASSQGAAVNDRLDLLRQQQRRPGRPTAAHLDQR